MNRLSIYKDGRWRSFPGEWTDAEARALIKTFQALNVPVKTR